MDYQFLSQTMLFSGESPEEIKEMLSCLGAVTRSYGKGEIIYHAGECVHSMGLVLSGNVQIESDDVWGNHSVLDDITPGFFFAETYASLLKEPLMVNVVPAAAKTEVLFLNIGRLLTTCTNSCTHHNRLIHNLFFISARKNLLLSRRIFHTTPKSIRGRLLSYLSAQSAAANSLDFTIPFNRQQLADYLNVDRSALSARTLKNAAGGSPYNGAQSFYPLRKSFRILNHMYAVPVFIHLSHFFSDRNDRMIHIV